MVPEAPLDDQVQFWDKWNAASREHRQGEVSRRQAEIVTGWLQRLRRTDLDILDVGCGAGWFEPSLVPFGRVTATDLAPEVLARARQRCPAATFVAGDFLTLPLPERSFDVVVTLEVLSHVADQPAFARKIAGLLRPEGRLLLATQNRPVLERFNSVPPPGPGQLRHWVDRRELRGLLEPHFEIQEIFTVSPVANRGVMRVVNSERLNRPVRRLVGNRLERGKERLGLGWTIMCRASVRSLP
jgi:2-polyprenyl-3-methyl-5-hydroxy-6-metoxy-1,4-benzoquinol methylase